MNYCIVYLARPLDGYNANTTIIPDNTKHSVPSNVIKISDYLDNI